MRGKQKFFKCEICGNIVGIVHNAGIPMVCCGEKMKELVPNTVDAAVEKHLPVVTVDKDRLEVNIGSADHPMIDEHFIEWVYVETEQGGQRKNLEPGDKPHAVFAIVDDAPVAAYAYCNLHGLWKTVIE